MNTKVKRDVEYILTGMFILVGCDKPANFDTILQFCIADIEESAGTEWNDDDVAIAFRRFIETK